MVAHVQIIWVDFDGREQDGGVIAPQQIADMTSYTGHFFRFKAEGKIVATYRVEADARQAFRILREQSLDGDKSLDGGRAVTVIFNNQLEKPVELIWVDFDGKEVGYGTLNRGQEVEQQTGFKHLWRFKSGSATMASYRASDAERQKFDIQDDKGNSDRDGTENPPVVEPINDFRNHPPFNRPLNLNHPDVPSIQDAIAYVTNEKRRQAGLQPLAILKPLKVAAQMHADDMVAGDFFDHANFKDPKKRTTNDRGPRVGITNPNIAENTHEGFVI